MNALLQHIGEQHVIGFFLVLGRVSPLFAIAPLFSSKMFPLRVRGIAAVALAVGLSPIALRHDKVPTDLLSVGGLMLKEILIGLAFSFAIAVLFAAVSAAGSFLDTLIGFSFGSLIDPVTGNQGTIMSQRYGLLATAVFVAIGGDGWVIRGLAKTYDLVPLTKQPALGALVGGAQHTFSTIFVSAVAVAAPVLVALIITDAPASPIRFDVHALYFGRQAVGQSDGPAADGPAILARHQERPAALFEMLRLQIRPEALLRRVELG